MISIIMMMMILMMIRKALWLVGRKASEGILRCTRVLHLRLL